jgi:DNA-binding transcriptional regulator LsrR (DeoR family)
MDAEDKKLLYKIAKAYYEDGLTQQQIGRRFGLSRIKISRLLRQAKDQKIIQITISAPQPTSADLERQLEKRFGLKEALVVTPSDRRTQTVVDEIGAAAADYLLRCLQDKEVVAISWGTAILATVNALPAARLPNVRVVQMIGGLGELEAQTHGAELARRMADALGARPRLLHAPGIVKDRSVRDALAKDPQVADTLQLAAKADIATVGIGLLETGSTLLSTKNALSEQEVAELQVKGAIGDIALQFFDKDGNKVRGAVDERIVGIDLDQIRKIPRVIAVAGGQEKLTVIHAALRGKLVNVLITDDAVAEQLTATDTSSD